MGFVGRHVLRAQADPAADAVDVCVNRKGRFVQRELYYDRRRFRADAFELGQPLERPSFL